MNSSTGEYKLYDRVCVTKACRLILISNLTNSNTYVFVSVLRRTGTCIHQPITSKPSDLFVLFQVVLDETVNFGIFGLITWANRSVVDLDDFSV